MLDFIFEFMKVSMVLGIVFVFSYAITRCIKYEAGSTKAVFNKNNEEEKN